MKDFTSKIFVLLTVHYLYLHQTAKRCVVANITIIYLKQKSMCIRNRGTERKASSI